MYYKHTTRLCVFFKDIEKTNKLNKYNSIYSKFMNHLVCNLRKNSFAKTRNGEAYTCCKCQTRGKLHEF